MGISVPFVKQKRVQANLKHVFYPSTMKLVSAATLFFTSAMADKWAQLGDLWNGVTNNPSVSDEDRKIMELFTISSVANYGCLHVDYSTNTPFFRCGMDT